jgi:formamidopyrimidine-DNA glycosylase
MPELPEVETVRRSLERRLCGRRIMAIDVRERRLRTALRPRELRRRLLGREIRCLGRRAKYLLLHLSDEQVLVFHLGMSGRLSYVSAQQPLEPHTHVRLHFDSGKELRFRDHRRFGMLFVVRRSRLARHPRFAHLGVEPLDDSFSPQYLHARSRGVRKPVKNFLMDAAVVVGVGNIYASEALHHAGVHPLRAASRVSRSRWGLVHAAVRDTLRRALHAGGTTLNDFHDADGSEGEFQVELSVYGRDGGPCLRCPGTIRRIVQAGRSTFYCARCQR